MITGTRISAASMRAASTRRPKTAVGSVCTGYAIGSFYPIS